MSREDNLTPFKEGQSGNPKGRPKGTKNMSTIIKEILDSEIEFDDPLLKKRIKNPVKYAIMLKLTQKALKGDLNAIRTLLDRTEGQAKQIIEQTNIDMSNEEAESKLRDFAEKLGLTYEEYKERMGIA